MRHTFLVVTVKRWLKSVYIYGNYRKIKIGVPLFLDHSVVDAEHRQRSVETSFRRHDDIKRRIFSRESVVTSAENSLLKFSEGQRSRKNVAAASVNIIILLNFILFSVAHALLNLQGCARGLFSRDRDLEARDRGRGVDNSSRGETETRAFRARDRDEAEAYQFRCETEPRHDTAPRDGLETEVSRPRPHPC